ncbi:MAG: lipoate--protein ligase family protein [Spirochaetota bacterium]
MHDNPRIYISDTTNPFHNLAAEECVLDSGCFPALIVYENSASVVLGKNQNPWVECSHDVIAGRSIPLLRRISGGGTVVHGPGNLNIGFIVSRGGFERKRQLSMVTMALSRVGIHARFTDRGDIYVAGRKVSGNAMCYRRDRVLHHATLLVNADLSHLLPAIRPPGLAIRTTAIASQRAEVVNLSSFAPHLDTETASQLIVSEYMNVYPDAVRVPWPDASEPCVQERREKHYNWEWVFGRTPRFEYCVSEDARVAVASGLIQSVTDEDICSKHGFHIGERFDPKAG